MHLTNDLAPEVGRPEALQKYIYISCLIFIFTAFQVFNEGNTEFHIDMSLLHPLMLKESKKSHCTAPEKGFPSQNKVILIHNVATCPPHYGFSYSAAEMRKGRNYL